MVGTHIINSYNVIIYSYHRFIQLVTLIPTDPGVLQRLGEIYDNNSDRSQAFQYYYEVIKHLFVYHYNMYYSPLDIVLLILMLFRG